MTALEASGAVVTPVADHVALAQLRRRPAGLEGSRLAQAACIVGVPLGVVSIYWGLGGTGLLDVLGGSLERQARAGHASGVVILLTVVGVKLIAAVLPLLAIRRLTSPVWNRRARALAWTEAAVLTIYGVVCTGVGLAVQVSVLVVPATANHRALAWHAYLWGPWSLVWGLLVAGALLRSRPDRNPTPTRSELRWSA